MKNGANPISAIKYLNPRYKKMGTSLVTVFVIINVEPHKIEVNINTIIAMIFFSEREIMTIALLKMCYYT